MLLCLRSKGMSVVQLYSDMLLFGVGRRALLPFMSSVDHIEKDKLYLFKPGKLCLCALVYVCSYVCMYVCVYVCSHFLSPLSPNLIMQLLTLKLIHCSY